VIQESYQICKIVKSADVDFRLMNFVGMSTDTAIHFERFVYSREHALHPITKNRVMSSYRSRPAYPCLSSPRETAAGASDFT